MHAVQHRPQQSTQPLVLSQCSRRPIGVPSPSSWIVTQHSGPAQHSPPQLQYPPVQQNPGSPVSGSSGQAVTPQRPQLSQNPSPSQSTMPSGQVQTPFVSWLHSWSPEHGVGSQSGSC
jgi:hypothetical protein